MGYLIKADHTGHSNIINWGSDKASRAKAQAKFEELAGQGYAMFALDADTPRKLGDFDPEANAIAIRGLQGG